MSREEDRLDEGMESNVFLEGDALTELNDILDGPRPKLEPVEEPIEEPIVEEPIEDKTAPVEEPVEEPVVEQPVVQPVVEEPVVEAPVVEEPNIAEELRLANERNELLLQRIEQLSDPEPAQPAVEEPTEDPVVQPVVQPATTEPIDFVKDLDLDRVVESPEEFNALLNEVYNKAINVGSQQASERLLTAIPELVVNYVGRHSAMSKIVGDFYEANPDLTNAKKTVAAVANDVHAEHPDWKTEDVFKESAVRARKLLGMAERAGVVVEPVGDPANPPAQRGRETPAPQRTKLAKEIDDLIS